MGAPGGESRLAGSSQADAHGLDEACIRIGGGTALQKGFDGEGRWLLAGDRGQDIKGLRVATAVVQVGDERCPRLLADIGGGGDAEGDGRGGRGAGQDAEPKADHGGRGRQERGCRGAHEADLHRPGGGDGDGTVAKGGGGAAGQGEVGATGGGGCEADLRRVVGDVEVEPVGLLHVGRPGEGRNLDVQEPEVGDRASGDGAGGGDLEWWGEAGGNRGRECDGQAEANRAAYGRNRCDGATGGGDCPVEVRVIAADGELANGRGGRMYIEAAPAQRSQIDRGDHVGA